MKSTFLIRPALISTLLIMLIQVETLAQYKNVKISDAGNACEPSISINIKYPNRMVVGADLNWVFYSNDFGNTWNSKTLKSRYGTFGNPCIISDNEGKFYYFHLSDPDDSGWNSSRILDRIVCQTSMNSKGWASGTSINHQSPKHQDKEWAVFDEYTGNIYLTWTQFDTFGSNNPNDSSQIMFSYSDDRGKSWKPSIRINQVSGTCHDTNETVKGVVPTIGPRGEVYIAWTLNERIFFDKTEDGGITWLRNDKEIARQKGGWKQKIPGFGNCSNFPSLVCDISYGDHHGDIYMSWPDQRNGEENTDIWLIKSSNGGETWSNPVRVNDDKTETHQFYSWMTIDQITGVIYILYFDRRNSRDTNTDVFLAYSKDGGINFVNTKISESPFVPTEDVYFGDYINISAHAGYVRPVWTRNDNGTKSIWTAIIDMF